MTLIDDFAEKQFLPWTFGVAVGTHDGTRQRYLEIKHPVALARFIAFAKSRAQEFGSDVFLRGQTADYVGMVPGLFRSSGVSVERLERGYRDAIESAPHRLEYLRFSRDNIGAVFQHYGMRTPWLDVVDNIYTALWFATHAPRDVGNGRWQYVRSSAEHGWLYLMATALRDGRRLRVVDLRKQQSSMNLRLQVQHGLSVSAQEDLDPVHAADYGDFVLARIRIPNSARFRYSGALASQSFFFPPPSLDESYRILRDQRFDDLLGDAERVAGLPMSALGRLHQVCYRLRKSSIDHEAAI